MEQNKGYIELDETRAKITEIDAQIVSLFEERMNLAKDVAEYKYATGKPILDAGKEAQKLTNIAAAMPDAFKDYSVKLYECIFKLSRDYQNKLLEK